MEFYPTEQSRIAEDERAFRLLQDKMIVFLWSEISGLNSQGAAHAKMEAEPTSAVKLEEHLFAARGGTEEATTAKAASNFSRIGTTKDALLRVQLDGDDPYAEPGVPLFAIKFDLGQLGHGRS